MNDNLSRFRAHCFQFSCNKLDPEEDAWMQEMLLRHPELQEEVDADRELASQARTALAATRDEQPVRLTYEQIRNALMAQEQARHKTWARRLERWWQQLASTPASGRGRGVLVAVAVLGVIATIQTRHLLDYGALPESDYRSVAPGVDSNEGLLLVVFKDDVPLGDLRVQLEAMHMRIRSGPDASGVYQVTVTEGNLTNAVKRLQDAALVREVQVQDMRERP